MNGDPGNFSLLVEYFIDRFGKRAGKKLRTIDKKSIKVFQAYGWPGSVRELHVRLTPGRYVLLCNMSGHYMGGMHRTLVVR